MATLSFSCPKCSKLHSRIKPEMVGHKVKCSCGFVFRLGAKKDKQPGVAEEIKRKRAIKKRKETTQANHTGAPTKQQSPSQSSLNEDALTPFLQEEFPEPSPITNDALGLSDVVSATDLQPTAQSEDDIPDAILIPAATAPPTIADPFANSPTDPDAVPFADLFVDSIGSGDQAELPATQYQQPARKKRTPQLRRGETELNSNTGPVISLIVSILALMAMLVVSAILVFAFVKSMEPEISPEHVSGGSRVYALISTGAMMLMSLLLTFSIGASGVTALMEMSQKKLILWAHKLSAILASLFMGLLFVTMVINVIRMFMALNRLKSIGQGGAQILIGPLIFTLVAFTLASGIAPLAVAITGFFRGRK